MVGCPSSVCRVPDLGRCERTVWSWSRRAPLTIFRSLLCLSLRDHFGCISDSYTCDLKGGGGGWAVNRGRRKGVSNRTEHERGEG